jgi:phosphonate transport system substrate-binding protein
MFNASLKNLVRKWNALHIGTHLAMDNTMIISHAIFARRSRGRCVAETGTDFSITVRRFARHLFTISLLIIGQTHYAQASDEIPQPFVVSGVIINSYNGDLIERFTQYLSTRSGYPLQVVYVNKYSELSRVLRENPEAVGWTCGAPYVQDSEANGQQLVAVPLLNKKPTYHSLILTRTGRSEKTLADFKGGVLAYSDPGSNSGFLSPRYALHKQGIDIEKHFRLLLNTGNHESSINALLNSLADVAAVDEYVWLAYLNKHPEAAEALHEIERMGPFPFTPIVTGSEVSAKDISRLSSTLLNMSDDAEGQKLLSEFYLDGFVKKQPAFYQPIKNMLEQVNIDSGN